MLSNEKRRGLVSVFRVLSWNDAQIFLRAGAVGCRIIIFLDANHWGIIQRLIVAIS